MAERYFHEPYRFIPASRSRFWCWALSKSLPSQFRAQKIQKIEIRGMDRLRKLIAERVGILLTPNHSRLIDTPLMAHFSVELGHYFFYVASYHLFKESAWKRWVLPRCGAFSIHREGADREAIRECTKILSEAERPLVLYPEGTWFRQNDRVGPLQEGLSLIARQAARKQQRRVIVLPIAIKYWFLEDPSAALAERVTRLEKQLFWAPQRQLDLLPRIDKINTAMIALKEQEFFGTNFPGTLAERIQGLIDRLLQPLEAVYNVRSKTDVPIERIRVVRQVLVKKLAEIAENDPETPRLRHELHALLTAELVFAQSQEYLYERPSFERMAEAVQRLEEMATDQDRAIAPMGAVIDIGEAIEVADYVDRKTERGARDPLVETLSQRLQGQLDRQLAEGPPAAWHCPPQREAARRHAAAAAT